MYLTDFSRYVRLSGSAMTLIAIRESLDVTTLYELEKVFGATGSQN